MNLFKVNSALMLYAQAQGKGDRHATDTEQSMKQVAKLHRQLGQSLLVQLAAPRLYVLRFLLNELLLTYPLGAL